MIRLVVVDDHPLIRESVQYGIADATDIQLVGEGCCGADFERLVQELQPDVVLLDLNMPQTPGPRTLENSFRPLKALAWCKQSYPQTRVVILSHQLNPLLLEQLKTEKSFAGYILKDDANRQYLAPMLRSIVTGEIVVSESIHESLNACPLSKRQLEVLQIVAQHPDRTYTEYAALLSISESVFRKHLSKIYDVLKVQNLREAILRAHFEGYIVFTPENEDE